MGQGNCFKGRQFTAEVILWAVRWYLMFPVSYRDLQRMLMDRGVEVDHTTIFRWIQAYAAELEKRIRRPRSCPSTWWNFGVAEVATDHTATVEIWAGTASTSGGISSAIA